MFTPVGANVVDVTFFVPGTSTPALTSGFGAVFTDVDLANTTSIQLFDRNSVSMGTFFVSTANLGLSFLGLLDNTGPTISRVRITLGNAALGLNDGFAGADVVVLDDFIYGEPNAAVPEPSSFGLGALGLGLLAFAWRRKPA